jgi:hypothetical protein
MAGGLRSDNAPEPNGWVERTRELDHGIDDAWADVRRARESGRLNLRRHAARRVQDTRDLGEVLVGLEQAVADTRSMARTIGRAGAVADWEPRFRDAWVAILARAADAVRDANVDDVRRVCEDLESLARRPPDTNGDRARRPVQGALVVNLRNILDAMAPVAAAQPVRVRSRHDLHQSPGDNEGQYTAPAPPHRARWPAVSNRLTPPLSLEISKRRVLPTHSRGRPSVQRALVFLGVALAVVILGWLQQRQETSRLRADLAGATSPLSVDPDSIVASKQAWRSDP